MGSGELEALRVIECLKRSGMEIKDIKRFMLWCAQGSETYPERLELFLRQKGDSGSWRYISWKKCWICCASKCWYYRAGHERTATTGLNAMLPDKLPEEVQAVYDRAHGAE